MSDLSLLPPLDIKNVDFSHLLGEIRALRAEMANLRESVAGIENKTPVAPEWPSLTESSPQLSQRDRQPLYVQLSAPKQRDSTVTAAWKQRASNTTSADTMAAISTGASATGPSGRGGHLDGGLCYGAIWTRRLGRLHNGGEEEETPSECLESDCRCREDAALGCEGENGEIRRGLRLSSVTGHHNSTDGSLRTAGTSPGLEMLEDRNET